MSIVANSSISERLEMKPTIFIVEDDPAVRESLKLILEMKGYVVEESEDGGSLLSRGRYSDLACVIMDINLPGENGLQILKRLRDRAIGVSVLIMSARSDERLRHEAKALAAAAFLEKPVHPRALLAELSSMRNAAVI
jgi:two-component system response regulator FixJ